MRLEVGDHLGGERAGATPPEDPFVRLTVQTAEAVYGKPAVVKPLGLRIWCCYPIVVDKGSVRRYCAMPFVPHVMPASYV